MQSQNFITYWSQVAATGVGGWDSSVRVWEGEWRSRMMHNGISMCDMHPESKRYTLQFLLIVFQMQSYLFEKSEARNARNVRRTLNQIPGNRTTGMGKLKPTKRSEKGYKHQNPQFWQSVRFKFVYLKINSWPKRKLVIGCVWNRFGFYVGIWVFRIYWTLSPATDNHRVIFHFC